MNQKRSNTSKCLSFVCMRQWNVRNVCKRMRVYVCVSYDFEFAGMLNILTFLNYCWFFVLAQTIMSTQRKLCINLYVTKVTTIATLFVAPIQLSTQLDIAGKFYYYVGLILTIVFVPMPFSVFAKPQLERKTNGKMVTYAHSQKIKYIFHLVPTTRDSFFFFYLLKRK